MSVVSHLDFHCALNKVYISGLIGIENFRVLLAAIYGLVHKQGYDEIVLDFSNCTAAFPGAMLPVCCFCLQAQDEGVRFSLILPVDVKLRKLFLDANWAYLIDSAQTETLYKGYLQIPATRFRTAEEQWALVDDVIEAVLKSVPGFVRSDLEALEWCLSEITDNVINHSASPGGGVAQLSNRSKSRKIEFAICDVGASIPKTLRPSHPEIYEDFDALSWAIREGVTRDPAIGQGNGLFGSSEVCAGSGGFISIQSGRGSLHKNQDGLSLKNQKIPFAGILIDGCISYAEPGQLARALKFHVSGSDFISLRYELDDDVPVIHVRSEVQSVGARFAASPIRIKAANLIKMTTLDKIVVDFSDINVVSSSFADEALGKLAAEVGLNVLQARIQLINASPTIVSLVNRAIQQRVA